MKGFILALQFLTRLPTPHTEADETDFAASMRWFPAVGLLIGLCVAVGARASALIDPWTAALAALLIWVGITGALHLDGLADISDASGAAHKGRDRLLAVLADPHVGSFGVTAIVLQLLAKLVLLHGAIEARVWMALILIPFAARIGPLAWTIWLPPLHAGLAARFRSAIRPVHIALWAILLLTGACFVPALLATPFLILLWGWHLHRGLGGISGDGHGAGIELTESGLLLTTLLVAKLL